MNPALIPLQNNKNFFNATRENPFTYNFPFSRASGRSENSYNFEQRVFESCLQKLDNYIQATDGFVKHQMFLGRSGSKTLVCTLIFLRAIAKGLNCAITCLSGERAQQLGGEHVHKMFKFIVNRKQVSEIMASQSVIFLLRDTFHGTRTSERIIYRRNRTTERRNTQCYGTCLTECARQ